MGSNPVATNKARENSPPSHEVKRQEAEPLALPARGSVAQRIMSMSSADQEGTRRTSPSVAQTTQLAAIYHVKPGDNPSLIAERFNIPLRHLFAANPELEPSKMQLGQPIRLPGIQHNFHIVQKGESFASVAARHNLTTTDLREANPHIEPKSLQIGQPLYLPLTPPREKTSQLSSGGEAPVGMKSSGTPLPLVHTIKAGETLSEVAAKHKVSLKALMEANPDIDPRRLRIGKEVTLPGRGAPEALVTERSPSAEIPARPEQKAIPTNGRSIEVVGHSAEWRPIPVDPRLLNSRYTAPMTSEPSSNFFVSAMRTLGHEGGLSSNPNDAAHQGGVQVTNYGITGMAMAEYLKKTVGMSGSPSADVLTQRIKGMEYEEALDIYASNYWHKEYRAIDNRVAFVLFDWGIIGGRESTLKRVQDALGVAKTGEMDAATVQAIKGKDPAALTAKITELRVARHRERVAEVAAKIKKWDDMTDAGGKPNFARPKDQSGFLEGWVNRARAVNQYAHSSEFKELSEVFERTAPQGADLMDPVRLGKIALKKHSNEPALIRMLQQRLTSVGYTVHEDGKFEKEMEAVVNFFQEHYALPRQPSWGPQEMRVLDALMVAKDRRERPAIAGVTR